MVAHLVRLKLRLVGNSLRRSPSVLVGMILGGLYALGLVALAVVGLVALRAYGDLELTRQVTVSAGSALVVGWSTVPVLLYGTDPTLEPSRFAVFAVPPRTLAIGLALAGLVGVPGLATLLVVAFVPVAWSVSVVGVLAGLVGAACGLATCVLLSRVLTTAASTLLQSRRGRDLAALGGFVALVLLIPGLNALGGGGLTRAGVGRVADVLAWTPMGWAWSAPAELVAGEVAAGSAQLVLAVLLVAGLLRVWERQTLTAVVDPRGVGATHGGSSLEGPGLFGRLPEGPGWAVAARSLSYWRRDPRFSFPAVITGLFPAALLVPGLGGSDLALCTMPALAAYLLGWGQHNDVGYDSTPFWLHVVSGVSGRSDRLGRLVPPATLAAVLIPLYAVVGAALADRWDLLPALLGLPIALVLSGFGVACVASAYRPYAVPAPGESPFATPPGSTGLTILVQLVCGVAILAACIPALVLAVAGYLGVGWAAWAALPVGIATGVVAFTVGLRVGSRLFDERSARLLEILVAVR